MTHTSHKRFMQAVAVVSEKGCWGRVTDCCCATDSQAIFQVQHHLHGCQQSRPSQVTCIGLDACTQMYRLFRAATVLSHNLSSTNVMQRYKTAKYQDAKALKIWHIAARQIAYSTVLCQKSACVQQTVSSPLQQQQHALLCVAWLGCKQDQTAIQKTDAAMRLTPSMQHPQHKYTACIQPPI
jgi:hypothetical protein